MIEPSEDFDLEEIYDNKINPLMSQIIAICKDAKMPMLATFLYRRTDQDGEDYCTTRLPGGGWLPERLSQASDCITQNWSGLTAFTITKADTPKE